MEQNTCHYCKIIIQYEDNYPLRKAEYSYEGIYYRCSWHAQFKCCKCDNFYHFAFFYYCPTKDELICGKCNKPAMYPVRFWDKTYAYRFDCDCGETHYDLLFSEFIGEHPYQLKQNTDNSSIECIIQSPSRYQKWAPVKKRSGEEMSLESALKISNKVFPKLKKFSRSCIFLSGITPEDEIDIKETQSKWTKTSKAWIDGHETHLAKGDEGDINRQLLIDPELWKLIGDVKGKRVLDAGCGHGYLSRKLAKKGARVIGVDFSEVFIDFCNKKKNLTKVEDIKFICASLTDLVDIESESVDLVVSNVVFVDIQDYKKAFKEINRVLKPRGRFVWSNLHPVFGTAMQMTWKIPLDTRRNEECEYVMIDRYFDSGGVLTSWGNLSPIWQFHRTFTEYSQALVDAGFVIRKIVEPKPDLEKIREFPHLLAFDADRWPLFILFECLKLEK